MTIWKILWPFWYNLWPFGIVCGDLLYFSQFGMFGPREIWQPCFGIVFFGVGAS
jgi:hypothetical protein